MINVTALIKKGDLILITLYGGNQVVGKYLSEAEGPTEASYVVVSEPKALIFNESKQGTQLRIGDLPGKPEEIAFQAKDIFLIYKVGDVGLIDAYVRVTSHIVLPLNTGKVVQH